jgi:tetratricopeptide (TPR) repeat protein
VYLQDPDNKYLSAAWESVWITLVKQKITDCSSRALQLIGKNGEHPLISSAPFNLSEAYHGLGNHQQQACYLECALSMKSDRDRDKEPALLTILTNLAVAYRQLHRFREQKDILERTLLL